MTSAKFCDLHSPTKANSSYRKAKRTEEEFHGNLRNLIAAARKGRLRSAWKEAFERQEVLLWLSQHRPMVFRFIGPEIETVPADQAIGYLVKKLDYVEAERGEERDSRELFHRDYVLHDRVAIFDMLLRAEASLAAEIDRRAGWGGKRPGAGRPSKRSIAAS